MRKITYVAMMAVLICVCSWITVPFTVPFTMQTFAVFCALLLLGGKQGTVAVCLYLLLGAVGLPVFSGFRGGVGQLAGPTGGYLFGFILTGAVYILYELLTPKRGRTRIAALCVGLAVCYLLGTLWFVEVTGRTGGSHTFFSALGVCVLPFVIPDLAKMALAVYVCDRVRGHIFKN